MNPRWINQDDIKAAIRANDGSASVPEIAAPLFARPDHGVYPRGCLARFNVGPDGSVTEATA